MASTNNESVKFMEQTMECMKNSPTCFHVIETNKKILKKNGFKELNENDTWKLVPGSNYYTTRNNSSLIAFKIPKVKNFNGFMIGTSHGDHPCYKVINDCETTCDEAYRQLTIEQYPSAIDYTWFDTPLSVAGRITLKTKDGFETKIVDVKRPLLMIPSLAAHMQREFEKKEDLFVFETRMKPLFSTDPKASLIDVVTKENNINKKDIIDSELFIYRQIDPILWGANNEFMSSRAIDDQLAVYASLFALLDSKQKDSIAIHVVFDNEEMGSTTNQGAASTFLPNVVKKIALSLNIDDDKYLNMIPNSFALSIDNAHGIHPNYTEKYNKEVKSYLGKGAVIKVAASYAYCTNGNSYSILSTLCKKNKVKTQKYYNRPGVTPGFTLAKCILPYMSIFGCDVGVPQLAMHSGYETCGTNDAIELKKMVQSVYSASLTLKKDGNYTIK